MARLKGLIQFEGQMGDLIAYPLNGKIVVRSKSTISKQRRKTGKEFERTRENSKEFGGASMLSAYIRRKLKPFHPSMKEGKWNNKLTGALLNLIKTGPGLRGQRLAQWSLSNDVLQNLPISEYPLPNDVLVSQPIITLTENTAFCSLSNITLKSILEGATHFKVNCCLVPLPEMEFISSQNTYNLTQTDATTIQFLSNYIPVNEELNTNFSYDFSETVTEFYLSATFVEFYQLINGTYYLLTHTPGQLNGMLSRY